MILDYYNLRRLPFGVTPDPQFLYMSRTHSEALAPLWYGLHEDRGFMALKPQQTLAEISKRHLGGYSSAVLAKAACIEPEAKQLKPRGDGGGLTKPEGRPRPAVGGSHWHSLEPVPSLRSGQRK